MYNPEFTPRQYTIIAETQGNIPNSQFATTVRLAAEVVSSDNFPQALVQMRHATLSSRQYDALCSLLTKNHRLLGIRYVAIPTDDDLKGEGEDREINMYNDEKRGPKALFKENGVRAVRYIHHSVKILNEVFLSAQELGYQYQPLSDSREGDVDVLVEEVISVFRGNTPIHRFLWQMLQFATNESREFIESIPQEDLWRYQEAVMKARGYEGLSKDPSPERRGQTPQDLFNSLMPDIPRAIIQFRNTVKERAQQIAATTLPSDVQANLASKQTIERAVNSLSIWMIGTESRLAKGV